jgi:hypothetical protein
MKTKLLVSLGFCLVISLLTSKVYSDNFTDSTAVAYALSAAPELDGAIDAVWDELPYIDINNKLTDGAFDEADFSGKFKIGWNGNFIYVLVDITDDVIVANPLWAHKQDNAVLYFDLIEDSIRYRDSNSFYKSINADASATGGRFDGAWEAPAEGIEVVVGTKDGGWISEWSIDVTKFELETLEAGLVIGLNVEIGDNDDDQVEERISHYVWSSRSDGSDWSNPVPNVGHITLAASTVSVPNTVANIMSIYPNPTQGTFRLNANASLVEVFSITGAKVKSFSDVTANSSLSMDDLSGLFFVRVTEENGVITTKKLLVK